jgi:hypothetical protein
MTETKANRPLLKVRQSKIGRLGLEGWQVINSRTLNELAVKGECCTGVSVGLPGLLTLAKVGGRENRVSLDCGGGDIPQHGPMWEVSSMPLFIVREGVRAQLTGVPFLG